MEKSVIKKTIGVIAITTLLAGCAAQGQGRDINTLALQHYMQRRHERPAIASLYGAGEKLNRHTSNGEVFNPHAMTAAHRTLPMGTRLLVRHKGRSVIVRINDRGPAAWTGRSLDLSRGAAQKLGLPGVAPVRFVVLR